MSDVILTAEDKERLIKIIRAAKAEGKSEEVIEKIVSAFKKKFGKQQTPQQQSSSNLPPQQTTQTEVKLAKQRFEAWKKANNEYLTKYPIEKYVPYTNGTFDVIYKHGDLERVYPNGRSQTQDDKGSKFYMGTYDGNWKFTPEDAKTTYDKYGDEAMLNDDEEKELGIKKNPNTGKYEKIDQTNTQNQNTTTPTQKKRGTPLSPQDYEGIDFKYKYPGDRNYRYGVKGTDWYAKNINNQKVFNITKDGFTDSVKRLNFQFQNAFKEVVPPVSPKTKTPETPTQDSTKVITNVPPVKSVDSTNTGINIPPQVKFVDSTTYKLEKI